MNADLSIFLDTNILLHFPQVKDIDWCHLSGSPEVEIVLCMQVIDELDEKKSDPLLGQRASRVLAETDRLNSPGTLIRPHVTFRIYSRSVTAADMPNIPNPNSSDDRILFLALEFQRTISTQVAICTDDKGMAIRSSERGLRVIRPDPETRLENPTNELQRKYQAAVMERDSLKNRLPLLKVQFCPIDGDPVDKLRFEIVRDPSKHLDADREIDRDTRTGPDDDDTLTGKFRFKIAISSGWNPPTPEQLDVHRKELAKHVDDLRKWVQEHNEHHEATERTVRFDIHVSNDGAAPAENVELDLTLPPRFTSLVYEKPKKAPELVGDLPKLRDRPLPPRRPVGTPILGHDAASVLEMLDSPRLTLPPYMIDPFNGRRPEPRTTVELGGNESDGFEIKIRIRSLPHHHHDEFGAFVVVFKSWSDVGKCACAVSMTMSNHPDKLEFSIPIEAAIKAPNKNSG